MVDRRTSIQSDAAAILVAVVRLGSLHDETDAIILLSGHEDYAETANADRWAPRERSMQLAD